MAIKLIIFDLVGTCLNWHSRITAALPQTVPDDTRSKFALAWRQAYLDYTASAAADADAVDVDMAHRTTLHALLDADPVWSATPLRLALADARDAERCVAAWHNPPAWPDVAAALARINSSASALDTVALADGSPRRQLDLCRGAALARAFDLLLPRREPGAAGGAAGWRHVLELLGRRPDECVVVAAHARDTRAAKAAVPGVRTVYVHRWTDDVHEDQDALRAEHDAYLEGMEGLAEAIAMMDR